MTTEQPRTKRGQVLLEELPGLIRGGWTPFREEQWGITIATIEAEAASDAFQKGEAAITALLDKQAAAGQPPPDEAVRAALDSLVKVIEWIHAGTDELDTDGPLRKAHRKALRALASPPPTAAPPEDWSEIQHPGYGEGAAPERVGGDKESRPVPPMEAGAAISPSTVSDQHSAPERVGLRPPAVSGLDGETIRSIFREQGWAIHQDNSPKAEMDPFAWLARRLAQPAARSGSAEASDKDE